MSQQTATIARKQVLLADPYDAPQTLSLRGRQAEVEKITAAWMSGPSRIPLSPLLRGEPGVGKNRIIYELAKRTGQPLFIFQGHEDVTAEDLACSVRFSDDDSRRMQYVASPLMTAMHTGGICFIDEIGKIRPRALALLVSVLDERRYIDSTLLGGRCPAHPAFRFVAATNTADQDMPEFLSSRMRPTIIIGPPENEELNEIIRDMLPQVIEKTGDLLDRFWTKWRAAYPKRSPTPRDIIHVFHLALGFAGMKQTRGSAALDLGTAGDAAMRALEIDDVDKAFDELFRPTLNP